MALRNYVRENLVSCSLDTPVLEVAKMMDEQNVGAVLVLNEGKSAGIVTDRDIAIRGVAKNKNVELVTVEEIMTPAVETVSEDQGIAGAIRAMKYGMVRRIVVTNASGAPTAVLSFDDLFGLLADEMKDLATVVKPFDAKLEGAA